MDLALSAAGKQALARVVAQETGLLAFDFDGTLSRIVQEPHAAVLSDSVRATLQTLAASAPTAVISGRSLADLRGRLVGLPLHMIGNHGLEGLHASERVMQHAHECTRAWLKTLAKEMDGLTRAGVTLEDKLYSLTFHYRQAISPQAAREAVFHAASLLTPLPRLVLGKAVVNTIPPGNLHKGSALLELMHQLGSAAALFVGDDDTDEDVFSLPDDRIVSVRVGRKAASAAPWYLERQSQIGLLLEYLVEARRRACVGPSAGSSSTAS